MGKCKFQQKWLEDKQFKSWLKPVDGQPGKAFCTVCKKDVQLCTMGVNALKSHMQSERHKLAFKDRQQLTVSNFFAVSVTSAVTNTSAAAAAASTTPCNLAPSVAATATASSRAGTVGKTTDLRVAFGANATLEAEVLWCLNTAVKHHSYASNDDVSALFQRMFPDSDIAKSFTCGKDKTSYILKFGLAPHFKDQLIAAVNKAGPFVLMFDESLNQSTVERGFSVNKEVETCNIHEKTVEAQRLVCDHVRACGGVLKVSLTKELLASVASARTKYRMYLDEERREREVAMRGLKRKALEDELEAMRKKKAVLTEVCASLQKDADDLAEKAESKAGTLMAQMITKSNTLRRRHKDKCLELKNVERELEQKGKELRHMQ